MQTKQELAEELKRCKKDPVYFIKKYIKVVHPRRGIVPFDLYPFQRKLVGDLTSHRFLILRKFRQAGITTIACALSLHQALFNETQTIPVLSKGDVEAVEFIDRVRNMFHELPLWMKKGFGDKKGYPVEDSKHRLKFNNRSVIVSRASGKEAGRSLSGNILILDEAAFIENIETIYTAAYPTISTGGSVWVMSTVNGVGNWYYKMYVDAEKGKNEYKIVDIHWWDHPEYKRHPDYEHLYKVMEKMKPPIFVDDWEQITKRNIGPRRWAQEYECEFLGTGETYVDGQILKQLKERVSDDYYIKYNNRMRVWKDPHPSYEYLLAIDCSLGRERDYSAFHIFNLYNGEQVAEFYSNRTPINELADIITAEGRFYNMAYVVPERNTIGNNLIDHLYGRLEYENIWCDDKGQMGLQTTTKTRDEMLALMEEAIRTNRFKLHSERLVDELLTFIVNDVGKAEAEEGCFDDLTMSLAIAAFVFNDLIGSTPLEHNIQNEFNSPIVPDVNTKYKVNSFGGLTEEDYLKWMLDKKTTTKID